MERPDKCRSCGAPIFWARTSINPPQWMPLDREPSERGNVVILEDDELGIERAKVLKKGERETYPPATLKYLSHFATCPEAEKFRRRR